TLVENCPIEFTFFHNSSGDFFDSTSATGRVSLDFSCFGLAQSLIDFGILDIGIISLEGLVLAGGTMECHSADLLSCSGNQCFVVVGLGIGVETDLDGRLLVFDGDWDALALLGGIAPVPLNGSCAVTADTGDEVGTP